MRPADPAEGPPGLAAAGAYLGMRVADGVLPSAVLEIGDAGGVLGGINLAVPADAIYDLASLTKVLATGLVAMDLFATRHLDLDLPVTEALPEWRRTDGADIRLRDLLTHASGLPSHLPLYERCSGADAVVAAIAAVPLVAPPRTTAIYSDLGFIVLGRALERVADRCLDAQLATLLTGVTAVPPSFGPVSAGPVVSTGHSAWRGRSLAGEVHDDNAAAMGGVAGHAGLFGSAAGVGDLARLALRGLHGDETGFIPSWAIRAFARRSPIPGSSRALAWDTALPTSSSGRFLSPRAIGHTGFTGTSLWIDPQCDRYVVLLTNRVAGRATVADMAVIRRDVHDLLGAAWTGARHA